MHNLIYLLLRRMRVPLIVVILAYAISILGMVLAPGIDDQGGVQLVDIVMIRIIQVADKKTEVECQ